MFYGAEVFNWPLEKWDTKNVVSMSGMFRGAKRFNQPIESWDTQSVRNMSFMFYGASSFNQSLSAWNTESVISFHNMFSHATAFNQSLVGWRLCEFNSVDARSMFVGATSLKHVPTLVRFAPTESVSIHGWHSDTTELQSGAH